MKGKIMYTSKVSRDGKSLSIVPREVFHDPLNNFFNDELNNFFTGFFNKGKTDFPNVLKNSGFPKMDAYYQDDKFVIDFAIPGMIAEDINLELHPAKNYGYQDGQVLEIYGKATSAKENKVFQISELKHSSFSRLSLLPEDILGEPEAVYSNGILKLTWNVVKKETVPKPKKIEVKVI